MEIGKSGVNIEYLGHAGFAISSGNGNGKNLVIDPFQVSDGFVKSGSKADIVLLTHSHYDHCSLQDIEKLVDKEKGCVVICPADCQSKIMKMKGVEMQVVELGDKVELSGNLKIETIAAYNKNKDYHPKSEGWLGYLIKIKNVIIYHSGDTDFIPEMQKLSGYGKHGNEFVALLPVSGKYVMNAEQASDAASLISPDLVIPMHYGAGVAGTLEDAEKFVELCKEKNIKAQILEKV